MSLHSITRLFPLWAFLFSIFAYFFPLLFTAFKPAIPALLMLIMFCMGITLTLDQFRDVLRRPKVLALGVLMQYSIMPLTALIVSRMLDLSAALMIGMILVGSSPGGTASNVVCYLARGNVALSVSLTMLSTLLAFVMTPTLVWLYAGEHVPVPVLDMLISVLKIVLIPVLLGAVINTYLSQKLLGIQPVFPFISMLTITFVIAVVVALNQTNIASMGILIVIAVILHNLVGLVAGYGIAKLLGMDRITCRTLAIETGMQNSGLSVALAVKYFSTTAALPGALFSIWHNLSGSVLASIWSGNKHYRETGNKQTQ